MRKQERLGYWIVTIVILIIEVRTRAPIDVMVRDVCSLGRLVNLTAKIEDGKPVTSIKED